MEDLRHGTITTWKKGCRCESCRAAKNEINMRWVRKNREKVQAKQKRYNENNKEKLREKDQRNYDPVKNRAYANLRYARKIGKVVKGECEQAGEDCYGEVQAHHDDYTKSLDVRWLCARHHTLHHLSLKKESEAA